MNSDPPQDKHRSEPSQAEQGRGTRGGDSTVTGNDPSAMQSRNAAAGGQGARVAPTQDAQHDPEQASDQTLTHEEALRKSSGEAAAKESVQSIPLTLPQGGNPAE
jgi:hypothetical protein